MAGQSPAEDKKDRRTRRESAVREMNRVSKDLGPDPEISQVSARECGGAAAATLYHRLRSDSRLGAASAAVLEAACTTMKNNGWEEFLNTPGVPGAASEEGEGETEAEAEAEAFDAETPDGETVPQHGPVKEFRLRGRAFLATWNSIEFGTEPGQWRVTFAAFLEFLRTTVQAWRPHKEWTAKMERSLQSSDAGRVHLHAYFSGFPEEIDTADLEALEFHGAKPRLDVNRERRGPAFWSKAKWHGHFYTYCSEKEGSLHWETNVMPWVVYTPEAWWIVRLWTAHKIGHAGYLSLSARARDGHTRRKADVEAVKVTEAKERHAKEKAEAAEILAAKWCSFRALPKAVTDWRDQYLVPDKRYKPLVLWGPSGTGKTELAKSLFGEATTLVVDVENTVSPCLREFDRERHKCVVFDEMQGVQFILGNKKLMQAHLDGARLGKSPTGGWEYDVWLWRIPLVCTTNHWPPQGLSSADQNWIDAQVVAVAIHDPVWEAQPKRPREEQQAG